MHQSEFVWYQQRGIRHDRYPPLFLRTEVHGDGHAMLLGRMRRGRLLWLAEDPRHLRPEVAQPLLLQYQARPHHPGTGPPAAEVVRGWLGTGEDAELPRVHARRVPSARLQPNGPLRIL